MITGKRVALRPVEESDYPDIQRWMNAPDTWWWRDAERPSSLEDVRDAEARSRLEGHAFVIERDGRSVGRTELGDLARRDRRARLSVPVGEPECWSEGLATDAMRALLGYAFARLDLHLVEAVCLASDDAGLAACEEAGFAREATLRDRSWKDGRWFDRVVLSVTREEFEASS